MRRPRPTPRDAGRCRLPAGRSEREQNGWSPEHAMTDERLARTARLRSGRMRDQPETAWIELDAAGISICTRITRSTRGPSAILGSRAAIAARAHDRARRLT